jgi:glycosyltransferase involved in cell wall biosynthesis
MTPKVSIIIPVYNVETYLRECLDSIIEQTFTDWECILVDDGSIDCSSTICDEYVEKDNRFHICHKGHEGQSIARNVGLEMASGNWISFVDADDWLDNGYFDELSVYSNADIIYFGFKKVNRTQIITYSISEHSYIKCEDVGQVYADLFDSKIQYFGYSWNKFFKRSIIDKYGIRFPNNQLFKEDEVFALRYSHHVHNIVISSTTPYNYRYNPKSITHTKHLNYNFDRLADYIESELSISQFSELRLAIIKRLLSYRVGSFIEDKEQSKYDVSYAKYIKFCRKYSKDLNFNLKQQIKIWLPIAISKRIDKTRI